MPDLLPVPVTVAWTVMLVAVLVFHCGHLIRMGGQRRWFHSTHAVMLLGMVYMYSFMEFGWHRVPTAVWLWIYLAVIAVIIVWMAVRIKKRRPFSFLWILALVQQAGMVYMWVPAVYWVALFSYVMVGYYGLETVAWLCGWCKDNKPGGAVGPGENSWLVPLNGGSFLDEFSIAVMAASMAYMFLAMQLMI